MPIRKWTSYLRAFERFRILRRSKWLLLPILAVLLFFSLLEITNVAGVYDGTGVYPLPLNQVVTYRNDNDQNDNSFHFYPTELLSVNLTDKTAVIRVKFLEGWRQFSGRQGEWIGQSGYFLESVAADSITVTYGICGNVYSKGYHFRFRWPARFN